MFPYYLQHLGQSKTDLCGLWYNRILYQRGVYPADDFHLVKKYGQVVMLTQDFALENYLDK